jgi:glucose/mannose-6-phosphate isomerase
MEKIDEDAVLASIESLPKQIEHAWSDAKKVQFPKTFQSVSNVVICGMGGSALGADVLRSLHGGEIKIPFQIVSGYHLPGHVGKDSLVILSSYSGNTEEVLSCAQSAIKRKAKIAVIAGGGKLEALAKKNKWPRYAMDAKHNPSGQPRMAIGYGAFGLLAMLSSAKLIKVNDTSVKALVRYLNAGMRQFAAEQMEDNPAKQIALAAEQSMVLLMAAEHMFGSIHVISNQINENAKHLSSYLPLPELNHHFLEGLSEPKQAKKHLHVVLFQSPFYLDRNQRRVQLTADLLAENGIQAQIVNSSAKTPLEQAWEAIHVGSFASFYLAMLHGINPAPVPNVESFKQRLAQ